MAVRYYRPVGASPGGSAGATYTVKGTWDSNPGSQTTVTLVTDKTLGSNGTTTQFGSGASIGDVDCFLFMVSAPVTAETLITTLRGIWAVGVGSSAADKDWGFAVHAWWTQGNTNTPRGTIIDNYRQASSAGQWLDNGSTTWGRVIPDIPCDTVRGQIGDRLIIELGVVYYEASGTYLRTIGTKDSGGSVLDDIAALDDGETHASWIEYDPFETEPRVDNSTPCCGSEPTGGSGSPNPFSPLPDRIPECTGAGTVPTAADPSDGEDWSVP
jgi:hypothetical protein